MAGALTISDVYKKQARSFLKYLEAARDPDEESIHKLRVSAKHLVSLFKFLEFLAGKTFKLKKAVKLISPVFKQAGRVRSRTLHIRQLYAYRSKSVLAFKDWLREKEKEEEGLFLKEIDRFHPHRFKKLHQQCLALFENAGAKRISKASATYLQLLLSEIQRELKDVANDETLHDIRKKLKDIKTISLLLKKLPAGKKNAAVYERLSALEDSVGKWHDDVSLAEEIGKYLSGNTDNALKNKALTAVLMKLNTRKELHKERLVKQLHALMGV